MFSDWWSWVPGFTALCFLPIDTMRPTASHPHGHAFPATTDRPWQCGTQANLPFLMLILTGICRSDECHQCHILISRPHDTLKLFRWGDNPGLVWVPHNHRGLYKKRKETGDVLTDSKVRVIGPWARTCWHLWYLEAVRKRFSLGTFYCVNTH